MSVEERIEKIKALTRMRFEYFHAFSNTILACFRDIRSAEKFKHMLEKTSQFKHISVRQTLIDGDTTTAWSVGGILK